MWDVQLDWDQDGTWSSIWSDVVNLSWQLGMGKPYQLLADESLCQIQVQNTHGHYTPENTSSPYVGNLRPHIPLQIVTDGTVMWRGWLERIAPDWFPAGGHTGRTTATLYAIGAKQFLQDAHVNLPLKESQTGDQIIGDTLLQVVLPPAAGRRAILGRVGFAELGQTTVLGAASDYSDLETGTRSFRYYGDIRNRASNRSQSDGYRIIQDITQAERGHFFFDRLGKAIWWNQDHLIDDATLDATLDEDIDPRPIGIDYQYGASVSNRVRVQAFPRKSGAVITLWELDKEVVIPAYGNTSFEAPFTDAKGNRAGALSASLTNTTFSQGTATLNLQRQAERATITLENPHGEDAILSSLSIEGQVLSSQHMIIVQLEDADSIQTYGVRGEQSLKLRAIDNLDDATAIAQWELERHAAPRGEVHAIRLLNAADGIANAHHIAWQIGTRLRVVMPSLEHDAEYFILGERHSLTANGTIHDTTFILEPAVFTRLAAYPERYATTAEPLKTDTTVNNRLAQRFQVTDERSVGRVRLWLQRIAAITGNLRLSIYDHADPSGGILGSMTLGVDSYLAAVTPHPNSLIAESDTVAIADLSSAVASVDFTFPIPPTLNTETDYWLVLSSDAAASVTDAVLWRVDDTQTGFVREATTTWKPVNAKACFAVYLA